MKRMLVLSLVSVFACAAAYAADTKDTKAATPDTKAATSKATTGPPRSSTTE